VEWATFQLPQKSHNPIPVAPKSQQTNHKNALKKGHDPSKDGLHHFLKIT
jgi:hypothetical protein